MSISMREKVECNNGTTDGRVLFSGSALLNAGNILTVFCKGIHRWIGSIVPSDPSALSRRMNCKTPNEYCDRKYTRLVTV
jgi:hypothetical protein